MEDCSCCCCVADALFSLFVQGVAGYTEAAKENYQNHIHLFFSFCSPAARACHPPISYSFTFIPAGSRSVEHTNTCSKWTRDIYVLTPSWNSAREKASIPCDTFYLLFITLTPGDIAVLWRVIARRSCDVTGAKSKCQGAEHRPDHAAGANKKTMPVSKSFDDSVKMFLPEWVSFFSSIITAKKQTKKKTALIWHSC